MLLVKAKLEAIDIGATTYEREFLSDIVLKDGRTVYEVLGSKAEKFGVMLLGPGE